MDGPDVNNCFADDHEHHDDEGKALDCPLYATHGKNANYNKICSDMFGLTVSSSWPYNRDHSYNLFNDSSKHSCGSCCYGQSSDSNKSECKLSII